LRYLYWKYHNLIPNGSKDIAQVKAFQNQVKVQGSQGRKPWYQKTGLFMRYPSVKYQNPIPYGSKDIAQVKVYQN
jgi:hypothetical protein